MSATSDDPAVIERLVVHREDLVAAVEARDRNRRETVLRVTPPFAARMRARLHVAGTEADYTDPTPIHVEPRTLIDDVVLFPGRGPDEWRERVATSVCDTVKIRTESGLVETRVVPLG